MRKFVTFAFIGVFAVSVASCGNSQGSNSASGLEVDSLVGPSALEARAPSGGGGKGGGKGGGGTTSGAGSFGEPFPVMIADRNSNGAPNWGDKITFNLSTTVTSPFVQVDCYLGPTWIYTHSVGYFAAYMWPQEFFLSGGSWTSGGADCTAKLYTTRDGLSITTLATRSFHVDP